MPAMNTTGNSRPLALCSVMSVSSELVSAKASLSLYSEISCRKPSRLGSSARLSYSAATPTNSSMFSRRPSDSSVFCAVRAAS